MADTGFYKPRGDDQEDYNPYDRVLGHERTDGEADWSDQTPARQDAENELRNFENSASSGLGGNFYQAGASQGKQNNKSKLSGTANKKGLAVIGLILIIVIGFGVFLGSSHSLLGPAISAKSLEQLDSMNAAQEMEMAVTLACISSGECEGELSDDVIATLEANGVEVGDDKKSLYYNGENISGDRLPEILEENVAVRSAVDAATLGQVANTLDETAINIDNNRGISKNMFADFEQSSNIEQDIATYEEIVSKKLEGQNITNTYTQTEQPIYKARYDNDGNFVCYLNNSGGCLPDGTICDDSDRTDDNCVMEDHNQGTNSSTGATTTATTKQEATDSADSYIANISQNVTKMSSWGCTALRLGQLLSAQAAANEKQQSVQTYSAVMEPISKMMAGSGAQSPYHALMMELTEETTVEVADYSKVELNSAGRDSTVNVGNINITGSAVTSPSLLALLTDSQISADEATNYSFERTNTVLNQTLAEIDGTNTAQCNIEQSESSKNLKVLNKLQNAVSEIITRGMSISTSVSRGSGRIQNSGGLAWSGTKNFTDVVFGVFVKKFFVNVNLENYIKFMGPAFGEASYANAAYVYEGVELGEVIVRGGESYFTDIGAMGSGQVGADAAVNTAYNKATATVIAQRAEVDRYNRSPFDITSPNTFLGSIAYSFLPLATNKNFTGLSSLIRNTGSSLSSIMGSASAASATTHYSSTGICDRFSDINMVGTNHCNRIVVTDPTLLKLPYNDPGYQQFEADNLDADGQLIENSHGAKFVSYCALRLSPPGILDANTSEELDKKKTPLQRIAQFLTSIFGFLDDAYEDGDDGYVDYSNCPASADNTNWENIKYASLWMLRQRQLIQVGAVKYEDSPLVAYIEKYWDEHRPVDYIDYLAKLSGMTYEDSQLVQDAIAYYTFIDAYDSTERIAMDEHPTEPTTGTEVVAKITADDQRIGDGEKNEPIIPVNQQIVYADVRNRSYAV